MIARGLGHISGLLQVCVVLGLAPVLIVGCEHGPRATPPPGFVGLVDTANRTAVLAYAESLMYDTVTGASDMQRLLITAAMFAPQGADEPKKSATGRAGGTPRVQSPEVAGSYQRPVRLTAEAWRRALEVAGCTPAPCTVGPLVRIDPEIGSYKVNRAGIKGGRILARIVNLDSATMDYPKLNLHSRGTTYWWVDSAGPGGYRSLFISSDTSDTLVRGDTLNIHPYPDSGLAYTHKWRQAVARFLWVPDDDQLWSACDTKYCCKSTQ
jgi:hypothetical protein